MGALKGDGFNVEWVRHQIHEAIDELQRLQGELDRGECDTHGGAILSVSLKHVMRHLCAAWNTKWINDLDAYLADGSKCELTHSAIPNFDDEFQLVDESADLGLDERPRDGRGNLI